ncbi:MAG TPA: SprT-like domain-containing protein [Hydrogenophaga sp.]|mgnify:CR=1 FL=1|uniref:SprT-like domain-containing protein n=1 Tax=Hydrogenophaga sp. TaxID=1904254 RepID=UPI002C4A5F97|nr:SprT-like domain-containing protein [Hydrogenophaga sp.]HMN92736.1 SprT-like domain-containing protein [Hydrogenophaga sp.]HMP08894.1 SprT-like domain-containing protein [Hydrogenophaga sp.]
MPPETHAEVQASASPTVAFYGQLQRAFDHFNQALFAGQLPPCLITLRSSGRAYGYHHKDRFVNRQGQTLNELGLHAGYFTVRPVEEVLSTLVHEMVHHWQDCFGHPSRSNPHNREWARKMLEVGLVPSSTGLPNGKDTGQTVSHYIQPAGPFLQACKELVADGFQLPWVDRHLPRTQEAGFQERQEALKGAGITLEVSPPPVDVIEPLADGQPVTVAPPPRKESDRVKYVCSGCGIKAWAASGLALRCGTCEQELIHTAAL